VRNKANIKLFLCLFVFSNFIVSSQTLAAVQLECKDGIKLSDTLDKNNWFKLHTHFKFDHTQASGDIGSPGLPYTSSQLRNAEISLKGGLGENFSFLTRFDFTLTQKILDAYLKFSGFGKSTSVLLGQVPVPYGLENAGSTKWNSFLEKSLPSSAFASYYGIGVYISHAWETIVVSGALTQHSQGHSASKRYNTDPFQQAIRITFSPLHLPTEVYHMGVSVRHFEIKPTTLVVSARPEARGPLSHFLLKSPRIKAKKANIGGAELAYLKGPFTAQAEYMMARVQKIGRSGNLRFHGWYGQASYILTGESRGYNFKSGTFGRIHPRSPHGAWEIAFRHSYLNLSNKNIKGGRAFNNGVSLGWTVNHHIRILGNYIHANIKEASERKKKVDIIGMRLQFVN
jgi:phosphate-selective porin OprO/OprP